MSNDINKMDVKQLRNEVQLLRDELAIMQRKYEDILYNLDDDNFSSRFVREKNNMKTAIEITEEGIKTKVSKDELDKSLESTMTQTAEMISSEVSALYENDSVLSQEISTIEQTANRIQSTVSSVFNSIEQVYSKSEMTDKSKIYTLGNTNYHYNRIVEKWEKIEGNSIASSFIQTDDGFQLTGDVSISGDTIVGGTITGASLMNTSGTTQLKLGTDDGNFGDLTLYRTYDNKAYEVFQVYDNATSINLNALGSCFLYTSGDTTYAQGNWDFSEADVTLPNGSGSGTIVAVFG